MNLDETTTVVFWALLIAILTFFIWNDFIRKPSNKNTATTIDNTNQNLPRVILQLDANCSNVYEWFKHDTKERIFYGFGGTIDEKSTLDEIKNLPKTDIYKNRFSSDKNSPFYFRRGKLGKIERFTAIDKESNKEIGHIECLFVESAQLVDLKYYANDGFTVGWVYCVYISPDSRKKGFGKEMVKAAVNHFHDNNIFDVYLIVQNDNVDAVKCYKKCGFQTVRNVDYDGGSGTFMKYPR